MKLEGKVALVTGSSKELDPLGRLGQPQDFASLVAFLAFDDADYITGSTFFVDGELLWKYQEQ